jgi:hypothetical protein
MKLISFLSRLAVICNIAFVAFVVLTIKEHAIPAVQNPGVVTPVSFASDLIITLGISAIFLNLILVIVYIGVAIAGKIRLLPKWMAVTNSVFLISQVIYFFFR